MEISFAKRSLSLFVYLLILDGVAIFFFTRGFLLTRTELSLFSTCSDIENCSFCLLHHPSTCNLDERHTALDSIHESQGSATTPSADQTVHSGNPKVESDTLQQCWTKPAIKKVIILIIDALRFDFVAHSRNFDGDKKPWMDKLSVLQRLVEEKESAARIFKFVADPPTTTLQRLKGLTTGGLPTFIDIGHSFGAPAIVEDNLLLQLQSTGKRVVMMGDDTWMQLFPTQFAEAYPFPSFNVKDLHTVDDGVIQELFPALHRDNWDVLIAHFLGVDHVGHIFGVESPLMVDKLLQYNNVIENVVSMLKNMSEPGGVFEDTLFIVMGDHGQTLNGDHGGGTPEEVETALFALRMHQGSSSPPSNMFHSSCDLEDPVSGCINTFSQLDFPATLAAVLGVPFPFGSVGQVNADLFTLASSSKSSDSTLDSVQFTLELMEHYKEILCINSWQVRRYLKVYAKSAITGFPPQDLTQLERLYTKAQSLIQGHDELVCQLSSANDLQARQEMTLRMMAGVGKQVKAYGEYLRAAASLARSQWTQFGLEWMVVGFLLLIASVAVRATALYRLSQIDDMGLVENLGLIFPLKMVLTVCLGSAYPVAILVVLHPLFTKASFQSAMTYILNSLATITLGVMVIASVIAYLTSSRGRILEKRSINLKDGKEIQEESGCKAWVHLDWRSVGATLFITLHAVSLFSNSYIVAEGLVVRFLVASSGTLYLRDSIQARSKFTQAVCFLALIWAMPKIQTLGLFKGLTVEESYGLSDEVSSSFPKMVWLLQLMLTCTTILLPLLVLTWLLLWRAKKCAVYLGSTWWVLFYGVAMTYFLIGVYWSAIDIMGSGLLSIPAFVIQILRLYVPRVIYFMSVILALASVVLKRLCKEDSEGGVSGVDESLVEMGTALLAGLSGTVILLMGRRGPWLSLLAILQVWCFLELQRCIPSSQRAVSREIRKVKGVRNEKTSFGAIVDWSLIATQLFYITGHSCAFDGLHYSAAFIGFDDFGFYQQGLLLATETFGASHILPVIGLPLLILQRLGTSQSPDLADKKRIIFPIIKGYLWFGILHAIIASVTTASVCIQRRHLMVWGIFAPKYVFDAVGFLLVDVIIILAASFYLSTRV